MQTELFLTFPPPTIGRITLIPRNSEETAGRFRVWLSEGVDTQLLWDRKVEGGFPELKVLVSLSYALGSQLSLMTPRRNSVSATRFSLECLWGTLMRRGNYPSMLVPTETLYAMPGSQMYEVKSSRQNF
jgi:hypothetical protein